MTGCRIHRLAGALVVAAALASAPGARAQTAAPSGPAPASPAPDAEDHIFALVQAGKCAQAKAAALKENDSALAEQIGLMCGAKPSGVSSKAAGGGGRRGGGGSGGGRRGGP